MAIPDFQTVMLPLLKFLGDGKVCSKRELIDWLAKEFSLTDAERKELLPSGQQPIFDNRVGWAKTYLKKAGLLVSDKRGEQQISPEGLAILKNPPAQINVSFLERYPGVVEFRNPKTLKKTGDDAQKNGSIEKTPEEILEDVHSSIKNDLAEELLAKIKSCSPEFFEKLVIDLVVSMGYGGSRQDAGKAVGKSGDGGIDGIIKEDRLGLDTIYIQAKRWEASVPIEKIRDFAGALLSKKARKGIVVTTSQFPKSAYEFVATIEPKIILIDGENLANLMIELGVGTDTHKIYKISKMDIDYFEE